MTKEYSSWQRSRAWLSAGLLVCASLWASGCAPLAGGGVAGPALSATPWATLTPMEQAQAEEKAAAKANWKTPDGKVWWPPFGGAVPGSQKAATLQAGVLVDRYGIPSPSSSYLAPVGTSAGARAMMAGQDSAPLIRYEVVKPIAVEESRILPWFGQPGMGLQYNTVAAGGTLPIVDLVKLGFLKEVR